MTDSDRVGRLLAALGPGELTAREVADALWLSLHAGPLGRFLTDRADGAGETADEPPGLLEAGPPPTLPRTTPPSSVPLSLPTAEAGADGPPAAVVRTADAPALATSVDLQRALRPLKRRRPRGPAIVLDEDATVQRIADSGVWSPVLRPAWERWLDVVLVVDGVEGLDLWAEVGIELRAALERLGAFRDVRVWRLRDAGGRLGIAPVTRAGDGNAVRRPRELVDPAGQRLFLVLTDGSGAEWYDGRAAAMLADWGSRNPVLVVQPLPERLWDRTGLTPRTGRLRATAAGGPNRSLRFAENRRRAAPLPPDAVPVPVVELAADWLAAWARLFTVAPYEGVNLAALLPGAVNGPRQQPAGTVDEVVQAFRATASPDAYRLATCLAVAPVSLPVARLLQQALLPGTGPTPLAEILLSGLFRRSPDGERLDFRPGVRDLLLTDLSRSAASEVLDLVSRYLADHAGAAGRTFPVAVPGEGAIRSAETFGWLPESVVQRLRGIPGEPVTEPASAPLTPGPASRSTADGIDWQADADRLAEMLRYYSERDELTPEAAQRSLIQLIADAPEPLRITLRSSRLTNFRPPDGVTLHDLYFDDVTFVGTTTFAYSVLSGSAKWINCRFEGPVSFRHEQGQQDITLDRCTFADDVSFQGASVPLLTLNACAFRRAATFSGAQFDIGRIEDCAFRDAVLFFETQFRELAYFSGCRFTVPVDFTTTIFGRAEFRDVNHQGLMFSSGRSRPPEESLSWALGGPDEPSDPVLEGDADDPPDESGVEPTTREDLRAFVALRAEVWVVDGRPRLHLRSCPEPHDRVVEPLDSAEAIELGFTPCATCKPVAALLAGHGRGGGFLTGWLMQTTEQVDDENMSHTLLVVVAHESGGALAVILNRPTEVPVAEVLPGWAALVARPPVLFEGGPVQKESAVALVRLGPDTPRLSQGVNPITSRFGTVDLSTSPPADGGPEMRVFAGYAGWNSGQLETQLAEGALDVVGPATDEMFTADPSALYRPDPALRPRTITWVRNAAKDGNTHAIDALAGVGLTEGEPS